MALFWRKIGDKVSGVFLALQIIEVQEAMESFAFPYTIKMQLHLKLFS